MSVYSQVILYWAFFKDFMAETFNLKGVSFPTEDEDV